MALAPPPKDKIVHKKQPRAWFYSIVVGFTALFGAIVYFCIPNEDSKAQYKKDETVNRRANEQQSKPKTQDKTSHVDESDQETPIEKPKEFWLGKEVKEHRVVTNSALIVETFVTADGKTHKYYHDERENILPSAADQMLALMTSADDGFGAPPLPHVGNFEDAFGDALKHEIVINENDSKEVKKLKERVIAARKELLDLMGQGVNANDIVAEYKRTQEDNSTIRFEAAKAIREMLDAGDVEGAKELCSKYNEVLERAGIMTIEIPEE